MLAGGAEKGSTMLGMAGFAAAKALSRRNDDPQAASRPWDEGRDGFVLADGSGVLMLESLTHALARGAKIYAEVVGFGASGDAHHITAPLENGEGAARSVKLALKTAGLQPEQIDYVNAHGTSTPLGDLAEVNALKSVFGAHAQRLAVSSTKSMIGHMLGAAGAVEAVFTVLALKDQVAPPTINLHQPSEGCDLDFVPNEARSMPMHYAISNSFGFGGTNGSLVFRRWEDA
jgi:3-oxoacyl-[acyl-carrier-protein] synthase II